MQRGFPCQDFKFKSKAGDVLPEGTAKVADDVADAKVADDVDAGRWQSSGRLADAGKASFSGRKQNAWEKYLKQKKYEKVKHCW